MMLPQVIFLGAPGSGKGTQAANLVEHFGYSHISTGDLLRTEIRDGSAIGIKVKEILDAGQLVEDQLVLQLLKKNCDIANKVYIFDGFPRNLLQAKSLQEQVLCSSKVLVCYFEINLSALVERIVNRRTCADCGAIYNLKTNPPTSKGACRVCGATKLLHRSDDREDTVRERLSVFQNSIGPMIEYYRDMGTLRVIDAERDAAVIYTDLKNLIK